MGTEHRFQWDKESIISKEENSRIRKFKKSAFTHCTDHVISQPDPSVVQWVAFRTSNPKN